MQINAGPYEHIFGSHAYQLSPLLGNKDDLLFFYPRQVKWHDV